MNVLVLFILHSVLQSRLLLHFGSSLTPHLVLDALAGVLQLQLSLGKTPHYSILASILPTIVQLNEQYGACPNITHYSTISVDHIVYIQLPANMSLPNEFICGLLDKHWI